MISVIESTNKLMNIEMQFASPRTVHTFANILHSCGIRHGRGLSDSMQIHVERYQYSVHILLLQYYSHSDEYGRRPCNLYYARGSERRSAQNGRHSGPTVGRAPWFTMSSLVRARFGQVGPASPAQVSCRGRIPPKHLPWQICALERNAWYRYLTALRIQETPAHFGQSPKQGGEAA